MTEQNRFDIIIAGAGAAGLSLLWRIINSPHLRNQKVQIIDQSFEPANDKTWCFWEDLELPDTGLIHHSWNQLLVKINGKTYSEDLKKYRYKCLRSEDFSGYILQIARESKQVTFLEARINDFSCDDQSGKVHTSKGDFRSKKIFQSVMKPPEYDNLTVDISLIQHFLGWEVESNKDLFEPEIPTFMDFDVPQENGTSFIYLLPFSKRKALVEYTVFSNRLINKDNYRQQLRSYLQTHYDLNQNNYSIEREEFGAIPMEDRRYPAMFCDFVWNIGIVGGYAKPSTGYTFSRIQKHTSEITKALEFNKNIPNSPSSSYRFRVYDLMMLYLLEYEKENAISAFDYLFRKNSFDTVLEFLSEESSLQKELSIFSKMPYMPFFRSIYKMSHRIIRGA